MSPMHHETTSLSFMVSILFPTDFQAAYPRYFDTNDPLSADDATKFTEDIITPAIANLSAVDAEISRLQATLLTIHAHRSCLQRDIKGYLMRRSVFHHFPPEVLARIFYWFGLTSTSILCIRQGPWVLARVCSRWRQVVLSDPSLWTHISIDVKDCGRLANSVNLLKRAISLSGTLPLCLRLEMCESMWTLSDTCVSWLDELTAVSGRWQYLSIHCSIQVLHALRVVHEHLGRLERLLETHNAFERAPRLTSVTLEQTRCSIALPLHQLTDFRDYRATQRYSHIAPSSFDCLDYLDLHRPQGCRNLTELHIVTDNKQCFNAPMIKVRHNLNFLLSLHFSDSRILDHIDTPGLQALHCAISYDDRRSYHEPFAFECDRALVAVQSFLNRTECRLQTLSILDFKVASSELLFNVLRLSPHLSTLELKYLHWTSSLYTAFDAGINSVISHLLIRRNEDPMLPYLRSFSVLIDNISNDEDGDSASFVNYDFHDFIWERRGADESRNVMAALSHVKVDVNFPMTLASITFPLLRRLKHDNDLDISISSVAAEILQGIRVGRLRQGVQNASRVVNVYI
ncbi:hypothetical protein BDZ89DRAFT_1144145 [Hymenopellis radicata]|nr:hypothetical protein BDZ89DRAFT_1144145 [Hymenopellis radicata]